MDENEKLQLEEDKLKILTEFRYTLKDILKPEHDDHFLLKWLTARNFDISKAEKMIRKSFKLWHILEAEDLLHSGYEPSEPMAIYIPLSLWGYDKEGCPVRCLFVGLGDFKGIHRSVHLADRIKYVKYLVDNDFRNARIEGEKTGKFASQIVLVLDFKNFDIRYIYDKQFITKCFYSIRVYQDMFPEYLKVAYAVNLPSLFEIFLNLFKPYIDDKTWKKVKICSSDAWTKEILQHVDPCIIPKYFNGLSTDPVGEPETFIEKSKGGKVPIEYYQKEDLYLKEADSGIITFNVRERSAYDHEVHIQNPGTIMKWLFQTKDHNIKFGVLYANDLQGNHNKSASEELVKCEMVESHLLPEGGELLCDKVGKYKLHFDNIYSWIVRKKVLLKVELEEPTTDCSKS